MTDGGLDYTFECIGSIHTMVSILLLVNVLYIIYLRNLAIPHFLITVFDQYKSLEWEERTGKLKGVITAKLFV